MPCNKTENKKKALITGNIAMKQALVIRKTKPQTAHRIMKICV